jgi:hypothetical protein
MSEFPARRPDPGRPSRQLARAAEALRRTELAIFQHGLEARYLAEIDRIDSQAVADVVRAALEEELSVLDWGLERADGSAAKAEIVARKVTIQASIDSTRIVRRFGGGNRAS